jgi:hypothetical protein
MATSTKVFFASTELGVILFGRSGFAAKVGEADE